jgi:maltooligosyltrehalose synthase
VREAKVHSSWIAPNAAYEAAPSQFVGGLLGRLDHHVFLDDLRAGARSFAWYGAPNGIVTAAIKCTSPGVPDLYQGEEMIELALVDPDNRRAVDYARRHDGELLIFACGRLFASLGLEVGALPTGAVWGDSAVELSFLAAHRRMTDVLTGTSFDLDPQRPLPQLLAHFPVAMLYSEN